MAEFIMTNELRPQAPTVSLSDEQIELLKNLDHAAKEISGIRDICPHGMIEEPIGTIKCSKCQKLKPDTAGEPGWERLAEFHVKTDDGPIVYVEKRAYDAVVAECDRLKAEVASLREEIALFNQIFETGNAMKRSDLFSQIDKIRDEREGK